MERDPRVWAATSYIQRFEDGADWRNLASVQGRESLPTGGEAVIRPLGDGLIRSLSDNGLGDAHGCYRVAEIARLGGWDGFGRAKWEDWALYLKIISEGGRILVAPVADYLYRFRVDSMARTYRRYPAQRLKARALGRLPAFEGFRLMALAHEAVALRNRAPPAPYAWTRILRAGFAAFEARRLEDAERIYRLVPEDQPDYAHALNLRGLLAAETGDLDRAADLMMQALASKPDLVEALGNLGHIRARQARFLEAAEAFRASLAIRPGDLRTLEALGSVLLDAGLFEQARITLSELLTYPSTSVGARINLARALEGLDDRHEAVRHLTIALEQRPGDPDIMSRLRASRQALDAAGLARASG
jgi:tetratricopeptide (TPR) repeat protein